MSITSIRLKNFLAFKDISLNFVPGVNVLVGRNGTGKTQILKAIYGTVDSMEGPVSQIVLDCFKPGMDRTDLCADSELGNIVIELEDDKIPAEKHSKEITELKQTADGSKIKLKTTVFLGAMSAVYIPVKDMLTHAKGLIAMSEKYRDFPFDKTLTRIIQKADQWRLREIPALAEKILPQLERLLDGQIVRVDEDFYVKKADGRLIDFAVEAEGHKKIGLFWQLLMNESITEDSILIWDEPEANLNPEYLPVLVECLLELSRCNVQVFVSTHNYLFAKYFDVRKHEKDSVVFHSLFDVKDKGVQGETAECFDELKHNSIMDAFNKLLDEVYGLQVGG